MGYSYMSTTKEWGCELHADFRLFVSMKMIVRRVFGCILHWFVARVVVVIIVIVIIMIIMSVTNGSTRDDQTDGCLKDQNGIHSKKDRTGQLSRNPLVKILDEFHAQIKIDPCEQQDDSSKTFVADFPNSTQRRGFFTRRRFVWSNHPLQGLKQSKGDNDDAQQAMGALKVVRRRHIKERHNKSGNHERQSQTLHSLVQCEPEPLLVSKTDGNESTNG
mmetsp:Transcript_12787/g.23880  ORF Transcript_12787/g.23880 Transcript_12787/m.23880 type:complete len:218 (+) Transcript_12787:1348-2001(+)